MSELDLLLFSYGLQPRAIQTPRENTEHDPAIQ